MRILQVLTLVESPTILSDAVWSSLIPTSSWTGSNSRTFRARVSLSCIGRMGISMPSLTRRQREVLVFILLGLSAKETARRLSISYRTVQDHTATLLIKFRVQTVKHLYTKVYHELV